jgi:uncharacterized membrane protein
MLSLYLLLKFVHVVAAIVWVGGVIALTLINARLTLEREPAALRVVGRQSAAFGQRVLAPASVTTLLAGVALVPVMRAGFPLWMAWGLAGILVSVLLGAVLLRPVVLRIMQMAEGERIDEIAWGETRRRMIVLNAVNVLALLSTVWAMVFKPTL